MKHARTIVGGIAVVAVSFLLSSTPAQPARAHSALVDSTPAAGQTLTALPALFSVTANADLLDVAGDGSGFGIQITDAAGAFYGDGCLAVAGPTVSTPASLGAAGSYLMVWQFVAGDGHPVSDTVSFTWNPEASFVPSAGVAVAPVCGVVASGEDGEPGEGSEPGKGSQSEGGSAAPLWISGGILFVVLTAGIALYLARRKDSGPAESVGGIS